MPPGLMLSQSLFDGFYESGRGQQRGVALPGHYDTEIVGQAFLGIDDVAGVEPYLFIEIAAGLHGVDDGMTVLDDGPVVPVERYETYLDIIEERASYIALVRVYHHRARALLPGQRKASIGVVLADVGIADAFVYNILRKRYGFFQEFEVDGLVHPLLEGQTVAREDMEEFVGDEVVEVFHFAEIRAKVDAVAPGIAKRVALLVHCGLDKHDFIGQGKVIALPLGTRQNAVEATPHTILLCGGEIQALALHEREQLLPRSVRMQSAAVNVKLSPAFGVGIALNNHLLRLLLRGEMEFHLCHSRRRHKRKGHKQGQTKVLHISCDIEFLVQRYEKKEGTHGFPSFSGVVWHLGLRRERDSDDQLSLR